MFRKSERYRTEIAPEDILGRRSKVQRLKTISTQPNLNMNYDFI